MPGFKPRPISERFFAKVDLTSCRRKAIDADDLGYNYGLDVAENELQEIHQAVAECLEVLEQAVDGKTRLVVITWDERARAALAKLEEALSNGKV